MTRGRRRHRTEVPGTSRLAALVAIGSRVTVAVVLALMLTTLVPVLVGLRPLLVVSGSMAPAVDAGDVLLVEQDPTTFEPGDILVVDDLTRPGALLSHRLVREASGTLILKGDANRTDDSTPVATDAVRARARLVVPAIGRPVVWWQEGRHAAAVAVAGVFGLALVGSGPRRAANTAGQGRAARRSRRRKAFSRPDLCR